MILITFYVNKRSKISFILHLASEGVLEGSLRGWGGNEHHSINLQTASKHASKPDKSLTEEL